MSMSEVVPYLKDYREARCRALNNEERMSWSTTWEKSGTPLKKTSDLFDKIFASKTEGEIWDAEYNKKTGSSDPQDPQKMIALGVMVSFLAGCRRDLRAQFAVTYQHRPPSPVDYDRHEYMRANFLRGMVDLMWQVIKAQFKGLAGKV